jgi:hypothetical protein
MIRIRYREASEMRPGFHADAEQAGRVTTVYLLDGIAAAQRREALRRLRTWARRGQCPPLPGWQLAVALAADRFRHARAGLAAHPAAATVPVMAVSLAVIFYLGLTSVVSVHVLQPRGGALPPSAGVEPVVPASGGAATSPASGPGYAPGHPARPAVARPAATRVAAGSTASSTRLSAAAGQQAPTTSSHGPGPAPSATVQPSATPQPSTTPSPTSTGSGGVCMDVGPFGICLHQP